MSSRLVPLIGAAAIAAAVCIGAGCGAASGGRPSAPTPRASQRPAITAVRNSPARIWAVGDSAGGAHAQAVASLIARGHPDRVLYLGDIYPDASAFPAFARVYGRLPVAPTPGNHDWGAGYRRYWRSPPEWYSFTAAGWRINELNSETGRRAQQRRALEALLRARGTCRIAFWHRPRWSGGLHGDNADMDPYWQALTGHARLVISGHDHDMQRFAPRRGLIQLVAGAGGYSHYPVNRSHPGLRFADSRHWGALRIDLRRGRATVAFVAIDGTVLDSQAISCR